MQTRSWQAVGNCRVSKPNKLVKFLLDKPMTVGRKETRTFYLHSSRAEVAYSKMDEDITAEDEYCKVLLVTKTEPTQKSNWR